MKFWDSSAVVPLILDEESSARMKELFFHDRELIFAWLTPVEVSSAIARRARERPGEAGRQRAERRLDSIATFALEIDEVHNVALRARALLHRHPLKASDATQLASALIAIDALGPMPFVTLDGQLATAARNEGLIVIDA